jgi:predicted ribosome quality control (RQC) complex YloA/Tae2 family protein
MQIPNLSLAYLVAELKPVIEGSILRKVQELENGWLKLKFQTRSGTKDLVAASDALFFTSYSMPAKQTSSGYGAFLKKRLANKKVSSFSQKGFDRIILMEFEGLCLSFELFAKGNIILFDGKNEIIAAYRKEQWKDRAIKKGSEYRFPSSKGLNPGDIDAETLSAIMEKSGLDTVRTLVKEVNIAPILAEEACLNAGLEKLKPAKEAKKQETKALAGAIKELYTVKPEKSGPFLAEKDGQEILLPFQLKTRLSGKQFNSINQALDESHSKQFAQKKASPKEKAFEKKQAELEKAMQRQEIALESLQQKISQNSEKAEAIYQNYALLFELKQALEKELEQKAPEKEVMYKLKKRFPFLLSIDFKARKVTVSLKK